VSLFLRKLDQKFSSHVFPPWMNLEESRVDKEGSTKKGRVKLPIKWKKKLKQEKVKLHRASLESAIRRQGDSASQNQLRCRKKWTWTISESDIDRPQKTSHLGVLHFPLCPFRHCNHRASSAIGSFSTLDHCSHPPQIELALSLV
jgi:hypothetical protein